MNDSDDERREDVREGTDRDDTDRSEAVISADDTGMLQGEAQVLRVEEFEHLDDQAP